VRASADAALSNALLDLYMLEMESRLYQHYASVEERIRNELSKDFLKREEFGSPFFIKCWSAAGTILLILVLVGTLAAAGIKIYEFLSGEANSGSEERPKPALQNPTDMKALPAPVQSPASTK